MHKEDIEVMINRCTDRKSYEELAEVLSIELLKPIISLLGDQAGSIAHLQYMNATLIDALERMLKDCPPSSDIPILWNNLEARRLAADALALARTKQQ